MQAAIYIMAGTLWIGSGQNELSASSKSNRRETERALKKAENNSLTVTVARTVRRSVFPRNPLEESFAKLNYRRGTSVNFSAYIGWYHTSTEGFAQLILPLPAWNERRVHGKVNGYCRTIVKTYHSTVSTYHGTYGTTKVASSLTIVPTF